MILILVVPGGESEGLSPLGAFISDTVYFQQFSESYGRSPFSFWGQYPDIAKWGKPIVGASYLLFCLLIGFVPRRMDMRRLAALTAAVLVGTQFTLSHGGGTYIGFYIAAFIILLFGPSEYPEPETVYHLAFRAERISGARDSTSAVLISLCSCKKDKQRFKREDVRKWKSRLQVQLSKKAA
jgi:peptidoglycan/LPS O-acetylase OafA/YrhL